MSEPRVEIARLGIGMVTLRCDLAAASLAPALGQIVGAQVPSVRRIVDGQQGAAVVWMSPDELMILTPPSKASATSAALAEVLAGTHHLVVDVSDARAAFRLSGPGARRLLAAGAPVDFAPEAFGLGDVRRSRLGQVAAAFWMREPEAIELVCFRSVAAFVSDWLDAAPG